MQRLKELIALRLDPKQLAELERIAKREDRAVSYIIRKAIDAYIQKDKRS
jgi:predicted DNA-binding protein